MIRTIDLNADVGEGFDDAAILPFVSSASIACGGHAGDAATMHATLALAARLGTSCGAHPGYADREDFGRKELALTLAELAAMVESQLADLEAAARAEGVTLSHVKPHGALYHACARRRDVARAVCGVVAAFRPGTAVFGPSGSQLAVECRANGLPFVPEAFADRRYDPEGMLLPRGTARALIESPAEAAAQALSIALEGTVATSGGQVPIEANTICIHSDAPGAAARAHAVREALERSGVTVSSPRAGHN